MQATEHLTPSQWTPINSNESYIEDVIFTNGTHIFYNKLEGTIQAVSFSDDEFFYKWLLPDNIPHEVLENGQNYSSLNLTSLSDSAYEIGYIYALYLSKDEDFDDDGISNYDEYYLNGSDPTGINSNEELLRVIDTDNDGFCNLLKNFMVVLLGFLLI